MGVGEALISTLLANGAPSMVKRTMVKPPVSRIGAASKAEVHEILVESPFVEKYATLVDRESAFEKLAKRAEIAAKAAAEKKPTPKRAHVAPKPRGRQRQSIAETFAKSVVRSLGGKTGQALVRGILGSLFKGS
jgi:cell division protein FtsX